MLGPTDLRAPLRAARLRRLPWVLGASLVALSFAAPASAQDKQELSNARAQFQRALELEEAGNYTAALETFRDVGQVRMTPQVRFHIATCEEKLGRLVTALGGYQLAFADADSVGDDFKAEVERTVARLELSIPKLIIERGKGAEAAEIQLDGVTLGGSSVGVPVPLDPGPHAVTAKAPDAQPFQYTALLAENEQQTVRVELEPKPREDSRTAVTLPSGALPDKPRSHVAAYVAAGVGAASLLGAGVLFGLRQSTLSDLDSKCGPNRQSCPSPARGEVSDLRAYNVTAQVALGVGVVGVGTAITLFLWQRRSAPPPTAAGLSFVPSAPGALAGASWLGRF